MFVPSVQEYVRFRNESLRQRQRGSRDRAWSSLCRRLSETNGFIDPQIAKHVTTQSTRSLVCGESDSCVSSVTKYHETVRCTNSGSNFRLCKNCCFTLTLRLLFGTCASFSCHHSFERVVLVSVVTSLVVSVVWPRHAVFERCGGLCG